MKKCILISILIIVAQITFPVNFDILNITNNDGLSNSSVNSIFQDSRGIIWFGTWDGLNMYNGREFRIFKPDPANPGSISNNIIRDILEDSFEHIWIATDRGINRLNVTTKRFDRFLEGDGIKPVANEQGYLIAKNSHNQIFAAVQNQGLFYFNNKRNTFSKLTINLKFDHEKMFFDFDDNLWIFTLENKLFKIVFKKGLNDVPFIENNIEFEHLTNIKSVFYNPGNEILLQSDDLKIYTYNISAGKLTMLNCPNHHKIILTTVSFSKDMQLWGTSTGLVEYDPVDAQARTLMTGVNVMSISKGTQNIIWIGTDSQGVWSLSPSVENFRKIGSQDITAFGRYPVRAIYEEGSTLWIGTKGGGLFRINDLRSITKEQQYTHFNIDNGLIHNAVFAIAKGKTEELWIGTDGSGINYYDLVKHQLHKLSNSANKTGKLNLSSVYSILPINENTLWVGTSGSGMYRLTIDRSTKPYQIIEYKQFVYNPKSSNSLSNNIVYSVISDSPNYLWIGTRGGGISRFNIKTEQFQHFKYDRNKEDQLTNDDILCLYKGSDGALWAGTSIGLNKLVSLNKTTAKFQQFTEKDGIPNNTIHGILEDENKNIWVSTNKGLAKLIDDKKQYRIISYYAKDGLQNNEFSDGAFFYNRDTRMMFFGGISGLNYFNPSNIKYSGYVPSLVLDAFMLDNQDTIMNDFMIREDHRQTLVLSYKNKSFSFKFVPLDYISSMKCEIAYQLEGYNRDWVNIGTSNTIVFANLPIGSYTLNVRCSNADKIWSDELYRLNIKITPPWWKTVYAKIMYVILFFLISIGIYKLINYQLRIKHQIELKEFEEKKTEEIHEAKLRFFTNIAHEFSNSLTLIYGPCEQLLRTNLNQTYIKRYINIIKSNSERMQNMIQQLLEFRKAETGHLKLNIVDVDVVELIKFTSDSFLEVLEQKKISLNIDISEDINWRTDRDCLEKIIFNLFSNAAKYTPASNKINVTLSADNQELSFKITNTGVGIKPEFSEIIFNRFEVLERFEMQVSRGFELRNGIGLALCKNLVEMLKGNIQLISDGKTFTSFEVILPYMDESQILIQPFSETTNTHKNENQRQPVEATEIKITKSDWIYPDKEKAGLILIIDDEPEIRNLLYEVLISKYEVAQASNGSEAIELMKMRLPRFIICDIIMPVMNGIEFLKIMKSQELTKHIPIIILSTKSTVENQIHGIETGADAYLNKPFHPRHLEAIIERLLNQNEAILSHSKSHLAAVEQFEGKLIDKEDKFLIDRIYEIIYSNIDNENLNIEMIANETATSKIQLYRKIKELINQTPTEFIRNIRLNHAEQLLKTTNKTVQEIMYNCGFNNKTYFYREFSKKFNETPKEYRNKFNQLDKVTK